MNTLIVTPTPDLETSREFYLKLKFRQVEHPDLCLFTDGKAFIEINSERTTRAGVAIYSESWDSELERLGELTRVTASEHGHSLADPNGVKIYLRTGQQPTTEPQENSLSTLGAYAGVTLECADIERTAQVWEALGFSLTMGEPAKGFACYKNAGGFNLSLLGAGSCPHLVFNPSLTYFNGGKNLPVIEAVRKAGIPITEEITHFNSEGIVDNIIIRDPGGYGFYVFND